MAQPTHAPWYPLSLPGRDYVPLLISLYFINTSPYVFFFYPELQFPSLTDGETEAWSQIPTPPRTSLYISILSAPPQHPALSLLPIPAPQSPALSGGCPLQAAHPE